MCEDEEGESGVFNRDNEFLNQLRRRVAENDNLQFVDPNEDRLEAWIQHHWEQHVNQERHIDNIDQFTSVIFTCLIIVSILIQFRGVYNQGRFGMIDCVIFFTYLLPGLTFGMQPDTVVAVRNFILRIITWIEQMTDAEFRALIADMALGGGGKRRKKTRKKRGAGGIFSCPGCGNKKDEDNRRYYIEDGTKIFFEDSEEDDDDLPEWPISHYQNLSKGSDKRPVSPFLPVVEQEATKIGEIFGQYVTLGGGRKKKTRKYKGNKYPYKNITKKEAIADFIKLKSTTNPRSLNGLEIVNYGTEKLRVKTKYRGKSLIERWRDKKTRKTLKKFANRLYKGPYTNNLLHAYRSAIALSWGTLSSMRTAAALQMYKKYNAKKVLDFTAGWGSRMTAALAADIDYIGIDSNKSLKKGYNKIIKTVKKHTKSKVKLFFQPAETVNYSKLDYDFVFTSPPYEYLELYEHMKNYEGTKKIKQAHSANDKRRKNDGFYDTFLIPTIKEIYKHLPKGKWMCLNVPDLMYDKIKKKWKACTKKEDYMISKRVGSNMKSDDRRGQEFVYCWKK